MKVQVLGCSATELPKSNLTSFLIDGKILLDAGTISSALDERDQWKIKHVLITHAHLDHIKDLPFFADNISIHNKRHQVTVMSIPEVIRAIKQNLLNDVVWPDFTKIPNAKKPIIKFNTISIGKSFKINSYRITAYRVNHTVPAIAFLLEDKKNKTLLYVGDAGPNDALWELLDKKKINGLIIEVSLPDSFKNTALQTGHLTPQLFVLELKKLKYLPERIFVSHCKPIYKKRIKEELRRLKMKNIQILNDGVALEI
jgi:ribonuclease BN (tRNA processing enzyme)